MSVDAASSSRTCPQYQAIQRKRDQYTDSWTEGLGAPLPEPTVRVCDTIASVAMKHADHTAVICGDVSITYDELLSLTQRIRGEWGKIDFDSRRVGILAHRSVAVPAYLLAAHLSRRSFVFLDPAAPEHVTRNAITSADARLTVDPRTNELAATGGYADAAVGNSGLGDLPLDDEAYVLYTSGSAGRPKGVSVSQRNLASSNQARLAVYHEFGAPRFLLLSPFFFDSSVAGIWSTLAAGGTLVIAREDERRDPQAVHRLIVRHRITHLLTVPSFYAEVLHAIGHTEAVGSLRVAICAGETLQPDVLNQHFATLGGVSLFNEYGPTECTVWSTYKRYDAPGPSNIGVPIPGTRVVLVDEELAEVPAGHVGQIAISGPGVSNGYIGDAVETRKRFVDLTSVSGATRCAYLTGDLGRWTADGELEFLGRLDNQVKIRGVRVNLDNIELALAACPEVQAVALAYDGWSALSYAFIVLNPEASFDEASVRNTVEAALGSSYVPDRVVFVASLPRTARDKIDRSALLASARSVPVPAPRQEDGLASDIAQAWERVLGVSVREPEHRLSFFDLGGNSMSVLKLSRALSEIAGKRVPVGELYRSPTITQQADLLSGLLTNDNR
ncbi:non-ribosomal peptide synthetase [Saccharopolyspora sp. NPDC000995]